MTNFCEIGTIFQIILLVVSLLVVIMLTVGCVIAFKYRYPPSRLFGMTMVLLFNTAMYVPMQIDSRITGAEHMLHLPVALIIIVTVLSGGYALWSMLYEARKRDTINNTSIKEAFDNLPTGVCFFNEDGLPVLCNYAMHRFSFAVCARDVQFITDLQGCLADDFVPAKGVVKDDKVFSLYGGSSWQLEKHTVTDESGGVYTQFVAFDVTDIQHNRMELTEENDELRRVQEELKKLSANMVTVTREEEILNTKMQVHDDMGRCLVEARKYLRDGIYTIPEDVIHSWKRAVSMLKYNNETDDDDMMSQMKKTCETLNLSLKQTGKLPEEEGTAYILTCAVRECVTNAVRYAGAGELYADFCENDDFATVSVSNNGKPPESEIVEGGGLSTLRRRVERAGGRMTVQSLPEFKLTVTVPKGKEGML